MMLTRTLIATLLVVTFSLFGSGAFAAPIAIVNAGFEDVVLPTDLGGLYYKVGDPPGWTSYQPGTGGATNPDFGTYRPNNLIYNVLAPEPNNVAYIDLRLGTGDPCETCPLYDGNYPDGTYPVGFEQTLSSTISANSRYDLSVEVGNPKSGDGLDFTGFGGYRIELLVGGNVIAEDNNTKAIGEGDFVTASLSFVTGSSLPPSLFLKAFWYQADTQEHAKGS